MSTFAMVLDLRHCIGCRACVVACKMFNGSRPGVNYNDVKVTDWGEYPDAEQGFVLTMCNHCEEPPCVDVCPVAATFKTDEGAVIVDYDKCIGCGSCVEACPYNERQLVTKDEFSFGKVMIPPEEQDKNKTGQVEKCTFCYPRTKQGLAPMCVEHCPGKCRHFGDLDDPESEVSKLVKNPDIHHVAGTSLYYFKPAGMEKALLPLDLPEAMLAATSMKEASPAAVASSQPSSAGGSSTGAKVAVGVAAAAVVGGAAYYVSKKGKAASDKDGAHNDAAAPQADADKEGSSHE